MVVFAVVMSSAVVSRCDRCDDRCGKGEMKMLSVVGVLCWLFAVASCDIFVYSQDPVRMIADEFRDMPAKFGPAIPGDGIRAVVVGAQPSVNGCSVMDPPPRDEVDSINNWIVLVARYNCSFEEKVRNAQVAGYNGVIVYNLGSNDLEEMVADNSLGINISSVFIGEDDGLTILYNYQYSKKNRYFVIINGDIPFNINKHLLIPFAVVVALCLIIMIVLLAVRCVRERRRARRHRLPYSSLKKIPTCKFAKGDPYDTCAICLDDYVEGDKLRVLPCAHAYHCKCIDPWLTKNRRVCPVCKRKVFANGERSRRNIIDTSARSAHESQTDTDSDDDRTPLVRSRSDNGATRGGTFNNQRENPFVEAQRAAARGRPDESTSVSPNSCHRESNRSFEPSDSRVIQGGSWPESSRGGPFLTGVLNLRGERFHPHQYDNESFTDDRQSLIGAGPSPVHRHLSSNSGYDKSKDKNNRRVSNDSGSKHSRRSSQLSSRQRRRRGSDATQTSSNSDRSYQDVDEVVNNDQVQVQLVDDDIESQNDGNREDQGRIGIAALPNVNTSDRHNRNRGRNHVFLE